jgi:dATP pyrophosphohydrolase
MTDGPETMPLRPSIECWIHARGADGVRRALLLRTIPSRLDGLQFWQAVSGGIDPGETPRETCVREIAEETGIAVAPERVTPLEMVIDVPIPEDRWIVRKHVFAAEVEHQPATVSAEHVDWRWVPLGEVDVMLHWASCHATFARFLERLPPDA